MKKTLLLVAALLSGATMLFAQPKDPSSATIPPLDGIAVRVLDWWPLKREATGGMFRFSDGRIVVNLRSPTNDLWSTDNGKTWKEGPKGPAGKTSAEISPGEILAMALGSGRAPDGNQEAKVTRSKDGWATSTVEKAKLFIPEAGALSTDDGKANDGMRIHHGMLRLKNGDLIMTMYGNYQGDTELADAYPPEFNMRKYRTIVVTSSDNGKTWGNPITVAYQKMLARGLDGDSSKVSYRTVPAVTQEGFCEADLTRAPNGDILCVMRTGGRSSVGYAKIFPTPIYQSVSSDEGKTWSPPHQIADRGVSPFLVTMDNGLIVCTYGRPGAWLIFSDDSGKTWKNEFQVFPTLGGGYNKIVAVGPDTILGIWRVDGKDAFTVRFQVTKTASAKPATAVGSTSR